MGTARSVFFTAASVIMIISGAFALVILGIMMNEQLSRHSSDIVLLIINAGLTVIYAVLNIISGINGLRYTNKRSNSAVMIRLPQASVIICLLTVILSFFSGIKAWHIAVIIFTGIVIPDIFMYAAIKKSYV